MASVLKACRSKIPWSEQDLGRCIYGRGFPAGTGIGDMGAIVDEIVYIEANDACRLQGSALQEFWQRTFDCLKSQRRIHPADVQALGVLVAQQRLNPPFRGFIPRDPDDGPDDDPGGA